MPPTSGSHIKYFPGLLCLSWPITAFGMFESTFSGDGEKLTKIKAETSSDLSSIVPQLT